MHWISADHKNTSRTHNSYALGYCGISSLEVSTGMTAILTTTLYLSLLVHIGLIVLSLWRVWRGENIIDRLMGADLISTLTISVLGLVAIILRDSIYIDVALGLAALGFIGVIALAKYIADEQMF